MKISILHLASLLPILLASCSYEKVVLNERDKTYIPYKHNRHELVFVNEDKKYDTLVLHKQLGQPSNSEFYYKKHYLGATDTKRSYLESYQTNVSETFDRQKAKAPGEPSIKRMPFVFAFNKNEKDSLINLYFSIDGRSTGYVFFPKWPTDTLRVGNRLYKDVITFDSLNWSLQYGLIRINEEGGRHWELVN